MPNMEWCVENIETNQLLNVVIEEEETNFEKGSYIIIFSSEKDAYNFIEEFAFVKGFLADMISKASVVQRIIFGPKISSNNARKILREEKDSNVKSTD